MIARRDVHLREKTLWRMLCETCARSEEVLDIDVEDLYLAGRCCPVKAKGAQPKVRHRGGAREDYALETVYRDAGSARLLPRLSYGQARVLLDEHTAVCGPGAGRDLREYRHSGLTHLGDAGASLLMLVAKSRHKKTENVRRYF